jgi:hypothetical protein
VKTIASGRIGQVAAKYGEHAPAATACCNACRACITSNIIGLATAAIAATGLSFSRLFRRSPNAEWR